MTLLQNLLLRTGSLNQAYDSGGSAYEGKYVMFAIMGQSNAVGRGGPIDGVLDATDTDILMYVEASDSIVTAADPLDHFDETADTIGYGLSFAKDWLAAYTPAKVILVGCAEGGTGFIAGDWEAGAGTTYGAAQTRWNAAYAKAVATYSAPNVVVGGAIWTQGEDEVYNSSALFESAGESKNFGAMPTTLFDIIRAGEFDGWSATTPVIVTSIPSASLYTGRTGYANIQAGLADIDNNLPHSAFVDGADLTGFEDTQHWNPASLRTMGSRIATAYASALSNEITLNYPTFVPDASNVETAIAMDYGGSGGSLIDGAPLRVIAGSHVAFENKRVFVENGAMQFDGDCELRFRGDHGTKPYLTDKDFSIKCRFRSTKTSGDQGLIGDYQSVGSERSFQLFLRDGDVLFAISPNGSSASATLSSTTFSADTWYDMEMRRIGDELELFMNGVSQETYTLPASFSFHQPPASQPLLIGDYRNNAEFEGQIESFSIELLS
jgi:hypothetical protein